MFLEDFLAKLGIAILGFIGFFVASHIYKEKRASRPLVCPMHFECDSVVNSDYSKFFGISVEVFGMIYYAFIFISYVLISIFSPVDVLFLIILSFASVIAFLFSLYLIIIQAFVLRIYCSWCLVSALVSSIIFVLTLYTYNFESLFSVFLK